ncbi:uncharacterized protein [Aegilops tauschii subsp. strangulata]|uniref:uncharacterized protein n=1 Tax=Aegilops tauschii subsp. strangulata TaxID=200361 RepID=UPI003CC84B6E
MNDIVFIAQSAFIKARSIHDNFLYVRNRARKFHRTKKPMLLFKLDIKKAFDSVRWDYLMDTLNHHGFPTRFRGWISALLSSASSRVVLNGIAGDPIKHAVFCAPIKEDVQFLTATLASFGEPTGLVTNCAKSLVAPIRCEGVDLDDILQSFPACRSSFPIRYLGLPLAIRRLRRVHLQHLEDKAAGKLAPWRGRHVAIAGRMTLVKAVLTAVEIYHLTPLDLPMEVSWI